MKGQLHALLADPLHGAAAEAFLEGVVEGAAGVMALGFEHPQRQGLIEMERDVVEQTIEAPVAAGRFFVVNRMSIAQVGKDECGDDAVELLM